MRKQIMITGVLLAMGMLLVYGCGKKEQPVTETTTERTTSATTQETTELPDTEMTTEKPKDVDDSKPDKNDAPKEKQKRATGVFDGFIDDHSVEIQYEDGTYEAFLVYDETVIDALSVIEDFETISFVYAPREDQSLNEIIAVE
ncbi:MAG: hypothetical protein ACI4CT_01170 [Lachnospiraceae bacterium]